MVALCGRPPTLFLSPLRHGPRGGAAGSLSGLRSTPAHGSPTHTAGVWADEQLTVRVGSCSAPGTLPLRHLLCVRFCRPRASFVLNDASNLGSYSPQKSGRFQACFNAPTRYRQAQASRRAPADPGRGIPAPGAVYGEMLPAVQPSKLGGCRVEGGATLAKLGQSGSFDEARAILTTAKSSALLPRPGRARAVASSLGALRGPASTTRCPCSSSAAADPGSAMHF